ncbi:glucokinase [Campylobacter sp. VicNov18]|uniref:glucokinase n=1 Tax=Campylobacter bilis TaxID=2691918 RepID=UPI00130D9CD3|nr:glucokinase [Campylobacter bilis]MPV64261.1 glucokinase [Campylobacter hepaticus]MBM0637767.1 glucokinase [Campylobacter bilis]MCC8278493.1 glucokinase [Campylobacter bilis]MCC8299987.1 glucokinase [Campylobacter bilis]MCC8301402.1 glucokinase [Campylobacter bilis]
MSTSANNKSYPRLLADIGGTNARFALEVEANIIENIEILACNDYNSVVDAVKKYLNKVGNPVVKYGAFAIANPVIGDWVQMTNHHWAFSIETTRQALDLEVLILINDFTAQAYAISRMSTTDLVQIGGTSCEINAPKAVLGPGTGLGVSGLIPCHNGGCIALAGEGGHTSFSPFDDTEMAIWQYARKKYGHVSAERFLSGSGLVLIYEALADRERVKSLNMTPELISEYALSGKSPLCRLTLDIFCAMLGTVSADLALTLGARGGVYLCGGIIPRFIDYFKTSPFRVRFENKGRFDAYLAAIPIYVVLAKYSGIYGVAVALENHLRDYFSKKQG